MRYILALTAFLMVSAVNAQQAEGILTADQQKGKEYWEKAQVAYKEKDYDKTFKYDKKAAKLGYYKGCNSLGICYQDGIGTQKDCNKAIYWYEKAIELGFTDSFIFNRLGNSYFKINNYSEANKCYRKALELGHAWGGWNLATSVFNGRGVQQDFNEAARLFAAAVECPYKAEEVCKKIVNDDNKYFYVIQGRWRNAAYNKRVFSDFTMKYPDAAYAHDYAVLKLNPNHERPFENYFKFKTPKAMKLLQQYAENGNKWAQFRMADLLWSGELPECVPQDKAAAIAIWEKNNSEYEARKNLVTAHLEGFYPKSIPQKWLDDDSSLSCLFSDTQILEKGVERGSREAAQALDNKIRYRKKETESDKLLLLNNSQETGYDKYAEDVKLINTLYQEAVNIANAGKEIAFYKFLEEEGFKDGYDMRNFPSVFVDFYTKYPEYDKRGILKKAQLLNDFLQVHSALYTLIDEPYAHGVEKRMMGLITVPTWETGAIKMWFDDVNGAIAICNKYASGTTMNSFFNKSLPKLKQKLAGADASLKRQRREYEAALNKNSSSYSSSRSSGSSSSSSGEIDWNKCEEPSGELCPRDYFGSPYHYENAGKIVFKNGHKYKYNVVYGSRDGSNFWHYYIKPGYITFDKKEDMIDYIIKKERSN